MAIIPAASEQSRNHKLIIKPIQATFTGSNRNADPYCKFYLGERKGKTEACKNGGNIPHWKGIVGLKTKGEDVCAMKIKDKRFGLKGKTMGKCNIQLSDLDREKHIMRWFDIYHKKEIKGKILLDISLEEITSSSSPSSH